MTCDCRNNDMIRLDENNHQIWREMGLATFHISKMVEVSAWCSNNVQGLGLKMLGSSCITWITAMIKSFFVILSWQGGKNKLSPVVGQWWWWSELAGNEVRSRREYTHNVSHYSYVLCLWLVLDLISDPQIAQKMKAAGKEHLLTSLLYPDAGHLIEPPFSPHFRATRFRKNGELSPPGHNQNFLNP